MSCKALHKCSATFIEGFELLLFQSNSGQNDCHEIWPSVTWAVVRFRANWRAGTNPDESLCSCCFQMAKQWLEILLGLRLSLGSVTSLAYGSYINRSCYAANLGRNVDLS